MGSGVRALSHVASGHESEVSRFGSVYSPSMRRGFSGSAIDKVQSIEGIQVLVCVLCWDRRKSRLRYYILTLPVGCRFGSRVGVELHRSVRFRKLP